MKFSLPDSPGWSALHLSNADWGNTALIVKREYVRNGGAFVPAEEPTAIVLADSLDPIEVDGSGQPIIRREAETALFKTRADIVYLGRGTEQPGVGVQAVVTAELRIDSRPRRRFQRQGNDTDSVNLFGYQSRAARLSKPYDPDQFSFESDGAELFWSARRSTAFTVPNTALDLRGELLIELDIIGPGPDNEEITERLLSARLNLPELTAAPLMWEGGADSPPFWCRRKALPLTADSIAMTHGAGAAVIWRATLPLNEFPLADLRRVEIREVL